MYTFFSYINNTELYKRLSGRVPSHSAQEFNSTTFLHIFFIAIFFFPSKQKKMLDSAVELIAEAASNSIFIFCFCNLIIVMILMGSKPNSSFDQEGEKQAPKVSLNSNAYSNKQETISIHSLDGNKKSRAAHELSNDLQEEHADDQEEERKFENSENEDDDDDELRRRFEEFIEKVNRGWKEEKLRTYGLV